MVSFFFIHPVFSVNICWALLGARHCVRLKDVYEDKEDAASPLGETDKENAVWAGG